MGDNTEQSVYSKDFNSLFKYKSKHLGSIQERRDKCLENQKERRCRLFDQSRQQFDLFVNRAHETDESVDEMECDVEQQKNKRFKFQLMKTEWFTDIPDDLGENWLIKCAPEGFRVMLVARRKVTLCYNNRGKIVLKLHSNFSGGGGLDKSKGTTVLDCIYNKTTKTIFILDCLYWNNMSMIDSEAEFRFYWLKSKFTDDLRLSCCTNIQLVLIDHMPAERSLIQNAMFEKLHINNEEYYYDGVVFYHKESHYYFGKTPLVGWLASFMLSELLHIDVSQQHFVKMPEEYKGVEDYIQNLKDMKKTVKNKVKNSKVEMDVC